jgi:hypothetical protein
LKFTHVYTGVGAQTTDVTVLGEVVGGIPIDELITVNVPIATMNKLIMYKSSWPIGFDPLTATGNNVQPSPNVGLALAKILGSKIVSLTEKYTLTSSPSGTNDDAGRLAQSVKYYFDNNTFTLGNSSTLSSIPEEAIKSINVTALTITALDTVLVDIETRVGDTIYTPALKDLFEQAVAYNRVGITGTTINSNDIPTSFVNVKHNSVNDWPVYGVTFQESDTMMLFVKYTIGKVRRYGIDPTVVNGLDPAFTVSPVLTLTFGGRTFDIPIGSRDPNNLGPDDDTEGGDSATIVKTYGIKLVATNASSVF